MRILVQSRKSGSVGVFTWSVQEHASEGVAWEAMVDAGMEINVLAPFTRANAEKARLPAYLWCDATFETTNAV